jgi:hypothetical protein
MSALRVALDGPTFVASVAVTGAFVCAPVAAVAGPAVAIVNPTRRRADTLTVRTDALAELCDELNGSI